MAPWGGSGIRFLSTESSLPKKEPHFNHRFPVCMVLLNNHRKSSFLKTRIPVRDLRNISKLRTKQAWHSESWPYYDSCSRNSSIAKQATVSGLVRYFESPRRTFDASVEASADWQ